MTEEEKREKWREADRKRREDPEYVKKKRERDRRYYSENKEKKKGYYEDNREARVSYQNEYRDTKEGRASDLAHSYREADMARGLDISRNITADWIIENIFGDKCVYCRESDWRVLGADRIDNSKPHTPENCVPCCSKCNTVRGSRVGPIEFQAMKFGSL